ncbi:unnamed protein product [Peronospora belbahrii]|uniref:Ubiquitin-like protease family profile domain-containing protein n=1 Tax=Peronospora belbahrii TaxID=622444 RepID=A0AAU9KXB0_9STRA|nr:unnamed protein product [Peronospora belbahrii]CAH0519919.1 unnamed protein product [Peronospora belbahrii]
MTKQVLNYCDVQLYESDVALFLHREWLNDNAMNFYLQYLTQTRASSDILLMDPAVVSCLLHQCENKDEYEDLARGLNLMMRRVCIIPVTDNNTLDDNSSHWSLLLYCDGHFRHLDSNAGHNQHAAQQVAKAFELLLQSIGRHDGDGASDRVEEAIDVPQQQNGYDCGIYVLLFADYFCSQLKDTMTLKAFATPERATRLRFEEIPKLIEALRQTEARRG